MLLMGLLGMQAITRRASRLTRHTGKTMLLLGLIRRVSSVCLQRVECKSVLSPFLLSLVEMCLLSGGM